MNQDYYDKLWQSRRPTPGGTAAFWDRRAASFNRHKNEADSRAHRKKLTDQLASKAGLRPESRVLDIGCGSGHYALLLARDAGEVDGIDISDNMIDNARNNAREEGCANARFEVVDWDDVDLATRGWEKAFQLTLACNTPAVNNRAALEKMMAASSDACCLITRVDTENAVRDELKRLVNWNEEEARISRPLYCAFNILWLQGYYPEVWYLDRGWRDDMPLEEAQTVHLAYLESIGAMRPEQRGMVADKIASLAVDGRIYETVTSIVSVMFWRV